MKREKNESRTTGMRRNEDKRRRETKGSKTEAKDGEWSEEISEGKRRIRER